MSGDAVDQAADGRVPRRPERLEPADILREELVARLPDRPFSKESVERPRNGREEIDERVHGAAAHRVRVDVGGPAREEAVQHVPRDEPSLQEIGEAFPRPVQAELREHEGDVRFALRESDERGKRAIERLIDDPRDLRLVRHAETRIEVRLERELAKERQAEGVDRADLDVGEAIADRRPPRAVERGLLRRAPQVADDALAHLGGGLSRERDREDVRGIDAPREQVDVARDQHARLPRAGRCFEHDAVIGIARVVPGCRVGIGGGRRLPFRIAAEERHLIRHRSPRRPRSPCGRCWSRRTSCRERARPAARETPRVPPRRPRRAGAPVPRPALWRVPAFR